MLTHTPIPHWLSLPFFELLEWAATAVEVRKENGGE